MTNSQPSLFNIIIIFCLYVGIAYNFLLWIKS
nr:MAG TPA: hypothetical protein [Caudoviricetes sp.]